MKCKYEKRCLEDYPERHRTECLNASVQGCAMRWFYIQAEQKGGHLELKCNQNL